MKSNIKLQTWFIESENSKENERLFIFHHAGGGASYYMPLLDYLSSYFNIYLIQLPGREHRIKESPYNDLEQLLSDLETVLLPYLDSSFIFLGHSMGAMIAFELAHRLKELYGKKPRHLFLSAMRAPHLSKEEKYRHLPDEQLLSKVFDLGGTQQELSNDKKLVSLILPTLRKDLELCDNYQYRRNIKLNVPVTILGGHKDKVVSIHDLLAWDSYFEDKFNVCVFKGGHFYFKDCFELLSSTLIKESL
ncbi:thioesterase II family protein [Streptococcus macacae]|uniref:Gramicidin S biosynthesis protein GrsT n=1 Tax=Streptococcus macacae NCTC 11558 TaxID=764298 RepID=G5JUG0_9STRE|nr:alpha/beta fold hydrolase [Streptococcus macacae]EHJ51985.1 putative gramicidin S biosynthesis protein GrsT [Streptococcus macacae NCTC 11558]SUN78602.1 putative thioesterase [Streptococcus macacae NCTC 11558]